MEPESTTARSGAWRVARIILGSVLLVILAIFVWPSSLGGCTTMTVVSGHSMEPKYHTGDLIVARCGTPKVGDIVIYQPPGIESRTLIIHRIVSETADGHFVMRGDNNSWDDPWQITDANVLGIAQLQIPSVGSLLRAPLVWTSLLLIASALLIWPTRTLGRGRRSAETTDATDDVDTTDTADTTGTADTAESARELVHH
jgi:signal peptidase